MVYSGLTQKSGLNPITPVNNNTTSTGYKGLTGTPYKEGITATKTGGYRGLTGQKYVPPPTITENVTGGVGDYLKSSIATVPNIIEDIKNPQNIPGQIKESFAEPFRQGVAQGAEGLRQIISEPGIANKVAGTAKLITGEATAALSPLSGVFHIASKIPVLKNVADALNIIPQGLGWGGKKVTETAIDLIPESLVSKESKNIIKAPLAELGSLAAQLVFAEKAFNKLGELSDAGALKASGLTPEMAKAIVDEAKAGAKEGVKPSVVPTEPITPKTEPTPEEYAKSQGYEPITPTEQLPTIEYGPKPKETLPTIDLGTEPTALPQIPGLKYEPITTPESPIVPISPTVPELSSMPTEQIKTAIPSPKLPEITKADPAEVQALTNMVSTLQDTIETMPARLEQSAHAIELVKNNYEGMLKNLKENISINGIDDNRLAVALFDEAVKRNDLVAKSEILRKLDQLSYNAGETLSSFNEDALYKNPSKIETVIRKSYMEKKIGPRTVRETIDLEMKPDSQISKRLNETIKKANSSKQSLAEFISEIKC